MSSIRITGMSKWAAIAEVEEGIFKSVKYEGLNTSAKGVYIPYVNFGSELLLNPGDKFPYENPETIVSLRKVSPREGRVVVERRV